jgi:hypothetical protein
MSANLTIVNSVEAGIAPTDDHRQIWKRITGGCNHFERGTPNEVWETMQRIIAKPQPQAMQSTRDGAYHLTFRRELEKQPSLAPGAAQISPLKQNRRDSTREQSPIARKMREMVEWNREGRT